MPGARSSLGEISFLILTIVALRPRKASRPERSGVRRSLVGIDRLKSHIYFLQRFHSWCEGICLCLPLEPPCVCHSPAPFVCHSAAPFVCHSAAQRRNLLLSLPSSPTAAPCGRSQSSAPVPCRSTALAQSLRSN